jgi:hypothetical protein
MITETLIRISFSVIGDLLLAAGKMCGGCRYYFTESQAASCKVFQCQNRRFRVFEAGYWKDFKMSKEQAKTLSWIFSFK